MFLLSPSLVVWAFIAGFLFFIVAERVAMVSAKGARALKLTPITVALAFATPFIHLLHVPVPSFVWPLLQHLPALCFAGFWALLAWAVVEVAKTVSSPGGLR